MVINSELQLDAFVEVEVVLVCFEGGEGAEGGAEDGPEEGSKGQIGIRP
jgi:hypothetical protein